MNKKTLKMIIFVVVIGIIIITRLFYLQVIDDSYKYSAMNNSVKSLTVIPARGEVIDRQGGYLAQSKEAYDLTITPYKLVDLDTMLVCNIIDLDKETFIKKLNKAKRYSSRRPSIIVRKISKEVKLRLDELNIAGFSTEYRTLRNYPYNTAGNILGYIGEVNSSDLTRDNFYSLGDYIGLIDIEKRYETHLRGVKGSKHIVVDAYGRYQEDFDNNSMDIQPQKGSKVRLTIDADLQALTELLMKGKIGSAVAIEPSTGEILAIVSSPTFNPDTLIGRNRSENYMKLINDPKKPLFNRAAKGSYPPGSTFKMAMALIALQEGVVNTYDRIVCDEGYKVSGLTLACHAHKSPAALSYALQVSCNAYFCDIFRRVLNNDKYENIKIGLDSWSKYVKSFGFGEKLGCDISGEANGYIPTKDFYNRIYNRRWNSFSVLSLSIGQGELLTTPLQLANFSAILANRGYFYTPHLIKDIDGDTDIAKQYSDKRYTMIDKEHFEPIIDAMWKSVNVYGTGSGGKVKGLEICGKTGTAENSKGDDHSTFIAFAPRENPKIAVSVYVEHGRWGSTIALPIASLMIEQYLTDTIRRQPLLERMKNTKINYPQYESKK